MREVFGLSTDLEHFLPFFLAPLKNLIYDPSMKVQFPRDIAIFIDFFLPQVYLNGFRLNLGL